MYESFKVIIASVSFWAVVIPSMAAIFIAFLSHQLAVSRQLAAQRKKQKIDYLISSFKSLMMHSNNPNDEEMAKHLRDASMEIQFLGSVSQVEKMRTILEAIKEADGMLDFDPLISSIRDELRKELNLEKVDGNVYWIHPRNNCGVNN